MTIDEVKNLRESEDKVEFKQAATQYNYNNGRRSVLGYVVALANEEGGKLILGVTENGQVPHTISGSIAWDGREGELEGNIYRDLQVRVQTEVLHEGANRVLIIHIDSRPIGRYLTFQDVPLMRVGEDLLPMSQEQILKILTETEDDFSSTICAGLTINDLDEEAIQILKAKYADKQQNEAFANQSDEQALIDLDLLRNGQLTYAALILLGKEDKIKEYLPQSTINLEYRDNPASIQYDKRDQFTGPYFKTIDTLWTIIDARNKKKHIQVDSYILDIPELNNEVIRESINNAVAHRDYTKKSEVVIKQSGTEFSVYSHGGFPLGVTQENVLTINSTPRNRLLAKAGLVERSGQGVDKIFYQNLTEGKGEPSFANSDLFQVTLKIPCTIEHPVFALFVKTIQSNLPNQEKLGVHDIITLVKVRDAVKLNPDDLGRIDKLKVAGAVREVSEGVKLSELYNDLIRNLEGSDRSKVIELVRERSEVKAGDVIEIMESRLSRRQVNHLLSKMVEDGILEQKGKGKGTTYVLKEAIE